MSRCILISPGTLVEINILHETSLTRPAHLLTKTGRHHSGSAMPIADNASKEGKAKNRRTALR